MIGDIIIVHGERRRIVYEQLVSVEGPKGVYSYVVTGTEKA